ncbi:MAG: hypothetical protein AAGJ35_12635, partial [Myxococcota bacterium]
MRKKLIHTHMIALLFLFSVLTYTGCKKKETPSPQKPSSRSNAQKTVQQPMPTTPTAKLNALTKVVHTSALPLFVIPNIASSIQQIRTFIEGLEKARGTKEISMILKGIPSGLGFDPLSTQSLSSMGLDPQSSVFISTHRIQKQPFLVVQALISNPKQFQQKVDTLLKQKIFAKEVKTQKLAGHQVKTYLRKAMFGKKQEVLSYTILANQSLLLVAPARGNRIPDPEQKDQTVLSTTLFQDLLAHKKTNLLQADPHFSKAYEANRDGVIFSYQSKSSIQSLAKTARVPFPISGGPGGKALKQAQEQIFTLYSWGTGKLQLSPNTLKLKGLISIPSTQRKKLDV